MREVEFTSDNIAHFFMLIYNRIEEHMAIIIVLHRSMPQLALLTNHLLVYFVRAMDDLYKEDDVLL